MIHAPRSRLAYRTTKTCPPVINTYTMFAAIAAALFPRRSTRNTIASAIAAAVPVAAAPTVLRADRRTRNPSTYVKSSNRVRFDFIESKCFDKRENPIVLSEPSLIDVRPIINRRILKELDDSLDGAYWSRPVGSRRTRRAPVRLGSA